MCARLNMHLTTIARKFPATKVLKSISNTCIPNYPDKNLPTIFVYFEGEMKSQFIGPTEFRREDITEEGKNYLIKDFNWVFTPFLNIAMMYFKTSF